MEETGSCVGKHAKTQDSTDVTTHGPQSPDRNDYDMEMMTSEESSTSIQDREDDSSGMTFNESDLATSTPSKSRGLGCSNDTTVPMSNSDQSGGAGEGGAPPAKTELEKLLEQGIIPIMSRQNAVCEARTPRLDQEEFPELLLGNRAIKADYCTRYQARFPDGAHLQRSARCDSLSTLTESRNKKEESMKMKEGDSDRNQDEEPGKKTSCMEHMM